MYRWIQTEYRAPSIRVTRHNEYESLRIGLNHRSPWSITAPGPIPILAFHLPRCRKWTTGGCGRGRRRGTKQRELLRAGTSSFNENGGLWTAKYNDESSSIAAWQCSPPPVDTGSFLAIRCVPRGEGGEGGDASKISRDEMSNARIEWRGKSLGRREGHDSTGWPLERVAPVNRRRVV